MPFQSHEAMGVVGQECAMQKLLFRQLTRHILKALAHKQELMPLHVYAIECEKVKIMG